MICKNILKKNKIKSLGLCDTSNLCGALEFAEKISKSGTQPIIGTQINFKIGDTIGLLPLFALNEVGYKNIIELSSLSYLENDELSDPHVDFELLLKKMMVLLFFQELFLVYLVNYLIKESLVKLMSFIIKLKMLLMIDFI